MPIAGFQSPAVLVHAEYPGLEVAAELLPCFILDRLRRWLVNPVAQPSRGRATKPRLRTGHAWVCVQRYLHALNHHNGPQGRSELTGASTTWVVSRSRTWGLRAKTSTSPCYPRGRIHEPWPVRVLSIASSLFADGLLNPRPVHTLGRCCRRHVGDHASARSSRTMTDLDVGVPLVSATESSGTSTLVSG
jgi:hypothetical protein